MNKKNYKKISLTTLFILSIFIIPSFSFAAVVNKTISEPLTSGLVGHWTMDGKDAVWTTSTAGTVVDRSGNGNTGTLTNMSITTAQIPGKIGQALKFDGANDYIAIPFSTDPTAYTICIWVKPSVNNSNLIVRTDSGGPQANWSHHLKLSGNVYTHYLYDNVSTPTVTGTTVYSSNRWDFVCGTAVNGGLSSLYVNGAMEGTSVSIVTLWSGGDRYRIGQSTGGGGVYMSGSIDDVRIYNRALSATEVTQLYNLNSSKYNTTPTQPLTSGLVGHWTMDGKDTVWTSSTAATVIDKSGNGNTGTLTNMSQSTSPVLGKSGQALKFDGGNDYITIPNSASLNNWSSQSISMWFKMQGTMNQYARLIEKGTNNEWAIVTKYDGSTYKICFQNTLGCILSPLAYDDSKWHLMTATITAGSPLVLNLYIDGVLVQSGTDTQFGRTGNITIGNFGGGGSYNFNVSIDDVRIYNRALSATEIKQLYNLGR